MPQTWGERKTRGKLRRQAREKLLKQLQEASDHQLPQIADLLQAVGKYITNDELAQAIAGQIKEGTHQAKAIWLRMYCNLLQTYHNSVGELSEADLVGLSDEDLVGLLNQEIGLEKKRTKQRSTVVTT